MRPKHQVAAPRNRYFQLLPLPSAGDGGRGSQSPTLDLIDPIRRNREAPMNVGQLLEVIFTAGVVFDNLSASRSATGRFLETGNTTGVRGRGDLALLEDLKAAGESILGSNR